MLEDFLTLFDDFFVDWLL